VANEAGVTAYSTSPASAGTRATAASRRPHRPGRTKASSAGGSASQASTRTWMAQPSPARTRQASAAGVSAHQPSQRSCSRKPKRSAQQASTQASRASHTPTLRAGIELIGCAPPHGLGRRIAAALTPGAYFARCVVQASYPRTRLEPIMPYPLPVACLLGLLACAPTLAADLSAEAYGFPLENPFEATIAGTPPDLRPELPADDEIRQDDHSLLLRPEREHRLPANFWAVKKLRYRLARQDGPAPLIFIIAGTGAHYAAANMELLKKVFYQGGFHVVQLSSPTS